MGSGGRAEKIKTYNYRDNRVTDHRCKVPNHLSPVHSHCCDEADSRESVQFGLHSAAERSPNVQENFALDGVLNGDLTPCINSMAAMVRTFHRTHSSAVPEAEQRWRTSLRSV